MVQADRHGGWVGVATLAEGRFGEVGICVCAQRRSATSAVFLASCLVRETARASLCAIARPSPLSVGVVLTKFKWIKLQLSSATSSVVIACSF